MFSQLKSEVSIMTGVIASAIMLLNGLHEKLDSALATAQENGALSEMQELTNTLKDQTSQLASAVAANTIADPNAGNVGLTPTPEAPSTEGDELADSGGDADKSVDGADATDNADGSGAEVDAGTDAATEASLTAS